MLLITAGDKNISGLRLELRTVVVVVVVVALVVRKEVPELFSQRDFRFLPQMFQLHEGFGFGMECSKKLISFFRISGGSELFDEIRDLLFGDIKICHERFLKGCQILHQTSISLIKDESEHLVSKLLNNLIISLDNRQILILDKFVPNAATEEDGNIFEGDHLRLAVNLINKNLSRVFIGSFHSGQHKCDVFPPRP